MITMMLLLIIIMMIVIVIVDVAAAAIPSVFWKAHMSVIPLHIADTKQAKFSEFRHKPLLARSTRLSSGLVKHRATRGVMVSTSAFLACHQCWSAGSSFAWDLNFRALECGIF